MSGQIIHFGISVRGVISSTNTELKDTHCKWITRKDGSRMTPDQLREAFRDLLSEGIETIPIGECSNWDYKKGCKGHPSGESG